MGWSKGSFDSSFDNLLRIYVKMKQYLDKEMKRKLQRNCSKEDLVIASSWWEYCNQSIRFYIIIVFI